MLSSVVSGAWDAHGIRSPRLGYDKALVMIFTMRALVACHHLCEHEQSFIVSPKILTFLKAEHFFFFSALHCERFHNDLFFFLQRKRQRKMKGMHHYGWGLSTR